MEHVLTSRYAGRQAMCSGSFTMINWSKTFHVVKTFTIDLATLNTLPEDGIPPDLLIFDEPRFKSHRNIGFSITKSSVLFQTKRDNLLYYGRWALLITTGLNSHNRMMLQNWRANVDLQTIVDVHTCARHDIMAKRLVPRLL